MKPLKLKFRHTCSNVTGSENTVQWQVLRSLYQNLFIRKVDKGIIMMKN